MSAPQLSSPAPDPGGGAGLAGRALAEVRERMVQVRRDIHAHPEVAWRERRTTALVAGELRGAGLAAATLPGGTGLVSDVKGDPAGPVVALRADIDALPMDDEKDVSYRSTTPGVAHSCGHDAHTAAVLGAGLALARLAKAGQLAGTVRLVFQPAEEVIPGGAVAALEAGVLDGVARVFALHCDPRADTGTVALRPGPVTAATDWVSVHLRGPGGHTARPQLTVDVVAALADVVVRTPFLLSRRVDPRSGLCLVWGEMAAGTAANVIPQHGRASGSVRVLDRRTWDLLAELVPGVIGEIAGPYGAQVQVDYVPGIPPAVNDPAATEAFGRAVAAELGAGAVIETAQSMGGEDFAWFLDRVPGVLGRLGVRRPGCSAPDLHRGDFDVDERAIGFGSRILVTAALDALGDPSVRS